MVGKLDPACMPQLRVHMPQLRVRMPQLKEPSGPVVKTLSCNARGAGSIPGQGTKLPLATQCGQKFKNNNKK